MWTAITRDVSPALADCQLSFVERDAIDVERARAQHAAYRTALEALGCEVLELPAEAAFPDSVFVAPFADYTNIEVDPIEPHAANAVRVGDALLYPQGFPRTQARLRSAGIEVTTVDVSELQKAEGAVTCCSILLRSGAGQSTAIA